MSVSIAIVLAGLTFVLGGGLSLLMIFAAGMSDSPTAAEGAGAEAAGVFITTLILVALFLAIHFVPIHWVM